MKLLVLAIDGQGMGHLNRTVLLSQSLCRVHPDAQIRFLAESPAFPMVEQAGFPVLKLPDPRHPLGRYSLLGRRAELERELMEPVLQSFRPRAVLIDFVLDPELFGLLRRRGCKSLLVLRKLRKKSMRDFVVDPAVDLVDYFVVPHEPEEFGPGELPDSVLARSSFTGPVVRRLEAERAPALRKLYSADSSKLVLFTFGGGGHLEAARLFENARQAVRMIRSSREDLQALLVYGPMFVGDLPPDEEGIQGLRFTAHLPELMLAADVVVCAAGYNSSQEYLSSGTPGVLVPLPSPGRDDQHERAGSMEQDGRGLLSDMSAESMANRIELVLKGQGPKRHAPAVADASERAGRVLLDLLRSW